jgi:hypothetical protein
MVLIMRNGCSAFLFSLGMYIREIPSLTMVEQRLGGEAGYEG